MVMQTSDFPAENSEEASHNGDAFWTLLMHLQSEYYQIKKADAILQNHRNRWMQYTEQWMLHQGQMVERMTLQWRKIERSPTPSGYVVHTPPEPTEPLLSRPDVDLMATVLKDQNGQSMPIPPVAAARQPLGPDAIVAAFDHGEGVPPPSTSRGNAASREASRGSNSSEKRKLLDAYKSTTTVAVPLGEATQGRSVSRESTDNTPQKSSLSQQARQPARHMPSTYVVDPDNEFEPEVSNHASMETQKSLMDFTTSTYGESRKTKDLSPVHMQWEELVIAAMHAAKKELRSLRPCWVQREQFLQKAFKSSGQPAGGFSMVALQSSRISRFGKVTAGAASRAPRLSMAVRHKLERGGLLGRKKEEAWNWKKLSPVMNPTSPKRLAWVFIGMGLMFYDLVAFPLSVFNPPDNDFSVFMKWFSQIYWTIDILISFCTGVTIGGDLVMDPVRIAHVYIKTWLPFDCLVTLPLWIIIFLGWDSESGSSIRSVRYFRMLRFLRLMRLAKFEHLLGEALEIVNSSMVLLSFGIVKLMVYLMLLNHFNGCLWYAVGSVDNGWADNDTGHVAGREIGYKYFCAVHWSLTQFQGTSEVVPGTTLFERIYAAVFLMFALMILAYFVSSLTNMMMQLQSLKDERNRQQRAIRSYLSTHKISMALSMRVKKYVDWKLQMLSSQKSNADVLGILPKLLVVELLYEVRGPVLSHHKFFSGLDTEFTRTFRRVCHEAVTLIWQAPSELIFTAVDEAAHMYFITQGFLRYKVVKVGKSGRLTKQKNSTVHYEQLAELAQHADENENNLRIHEVSKDAFMCEAALWVDWDHCGELRTKTDTAVLALESHAFGEIIQLAPPAHASSVLYARRFLAALNKFGKIYTDILPGEGIVQFNRQQAMFRLNQQGTECDDE